MEKKWKRKEYFFDGKLKFMGKYLNGIRWIGKGYSKIGNIDFEIKEGNGKGKEYYDNDNLKFEGEYLNGQRNGKGKEGYYNDMLKFKAEYFYENKWSGQGYNIIGEIDFEIKEGNGKVKEYNQTAKL